METFKSLVEAVKENNRINDAKWSDWASAHDIQDAYGKLEEDALKETSELFLNALIRDDGDNLKIYLQCIECLEMGQSFCD